MTAACDQRSSPGSEVITHGEASVGACVPIGVFRLPTQERDDNIYLTSTDSWS
jgi:hypothetical protein